MIPDAITTWATESLVGVSIFGLGTAEVFLLLSAIGLPPIKYLPPLWVMIHVVVATVFLAGHGAAASIAWTAFALISWKAIKYLSRHAKSAKRTA